MHPQKQPMLPETDEEVEKHFCTRELGTTGLALFGIYKIRRNRDKMTVREAFFSTVERWVEIAEESTQ